VGLNACTATPQFLTHPPNCRTYDSPDESGGNEGHHDEDGGGTEADSDGDGDGDGGLASQRAVAATANSKPGVEHKGAGCDGDADTNATEDDAVAGRTSRVAACRKCDDPGRHVAHSEDCPRKARSRAKGSAAASVPNRSKGSRAPAAAAIAVATASATKTSRTSPPDEVGETEFGAAATKEAESTCDVVHYTTVKDNETPAYIATKMKLPVEQILSCNRSRNGFVFPPPPQPCFDTSRARHGMAG